MRIKQVEELVGITKKNIRFYEEQGLLEVNRAENGYREYGLDDVKRLQQIKLLRKLSVPVENIRQILNGEISVEDCLERQAILLERQKQNIDGQQQFIRQMLMEPVTLQSLDAEDCLIKMERLEKEGVLFMEEETMRLHRKHSVGAAVGAGIVILWMVFIIGMMAWLNAANHIPVAFAVIALICAAVIVCAVIALVTRLREIKVGEEDEAAKY